MAVRGWGHVLGLACVGVFGGAGAASADAPYSFTTGAADGRMAMASQPGLGGRVEIEAADDFALAGQTSISGATFTGLLAGGASTSSIGDVVVEVYRVFPLDSNGARTPNVPTRANSPSDVAFATRESAGAQLAFTTSTLSGSFTAANSVLNGIHPSPGQTTGGDGATGAGTEAQISVTFTTPFVLPAGHYFFVPQVQVSAGQFYWLSAAGPTGTGDLQAWIRNAALDPDWLRVGTDIVGGTTPPKFNGSFSLSGEVCPTVAVANPPEGTVGVAYSATLTSGSAGGPFTFTETGALPGVSLSGAGALTGTPTQPGSFPIMVTLSEANGCTATVPVTVNVVAAPTTSLPSTPPTTTTSRPPGTAVRLSALRITPSSFTAAHGGLVSFVLDGPARVSLKLERVQVGRRGRHQPCRPASRANRHGRRCVLTIPVRGSVTVSGQPGDNHFPFIRPKLVPGRYVLTATPVHGASRRATFTVKRPAHPKRKHK